MNCEVMFKHLSVLLLLTVVIGAATVSIAQMDTATLSGTVMDQSGAAIPDSQVQATNSDTNITVAANTNRSGLYLFPALKPGRYRIVVTKQGFKQISVTDVVLNVQDVISRNFNLQIGASSETISVTASASDLRMSPGVGTVVDERLVQELPLNGRSFQTLFQLTPGVVMAAANNGSPGQFSVNGQRTNANYFMVDGASATGNAAPAFNQLQALGGSLPPLSALGGTNSLVSVEAVQEFAIQTSSFAPEFGRTPGGQVSIVTRSGSNQFHGSLFDYFRNDLFDANDWFANNLGLEKANLRQNDFGGVFGGPIVKNRTFFFLSYEGLRLRQPTTGQTDVPSIATRQSAPSGMQEFFNAYPLPTGADEGNGLSPADYAFSNPSILDTGSIRIDHHITAALGIFGRYNESRSALSLRGAGDTFHSLNTINKTENSLRTGTVGLNYAITPTVNEEARFNWTRGSGSNFYTVDGFGGAGALSLQNVLPSSCTSRTCLFILALFLNGRGLELETGTNVGSVQEQVNFVDNVAWQIGTHLLKMGVDFRRLAPSFTPRTYSQLAAFSTVQAASTGNVTVGQVEANEAVNGRYANYSLYGGDSWRPSSRLSLTYGLRWDYNPAPTLSNGSGLQPLIVHDISNPAAVFLAPAGSPIYRATVNNIAPRLGLAYQLRSSGAWQSVVRAGAGIFYDLGNGPSGSTFQSSPFFTSKLVPGGTIFPFSATEAASVPPSTAPPFSLVPGFPSTLRSPYTEQWNLAVEQSLGQSQTVTAGYVAARGHNLLRTVMYLPPAIPAEFGEIDFSDNSGYSNYNALQLQFRRRTGAFDVLSSYTLAHSLDNVSTDARVATGIPGQFINPHLDYASSDFDIRHTGTVGIDYQVPSAGSSNVMRGVLGGWAFDPILTVRSSPVINVTETRNIGFGSYSLRPDSNQGVPLFVSDSKLPGGRKINAAAFSVPSNARQGDLGRNSLRGFSLFQADVAIRRRFRLTEKLSLLARIEAFNILNHPNFAPEASNLGTVLSSGTLLPQPGFGISPSMLGQYLGTGQAGAGFNPLYQIGGPRSLQLALKMEF